MKNLIESLRNKEDDNKVLWGILDWHPDEEDKYKNHLHSYRLTGTYRPIDSLYVLCYNYLQMHINNLEHLPNPLNENIPLTKSYILTRIRNMVTRMSEEEYKYFLYDIDVYMQPSKEISIIEVFSYHEDMYDDIEKANSIVGVVMVIGVISILGLLYLF